MDFNKELMKSRGYGEYEQLDTANVPPLWLAYVGDPSDSGKSTIKCFTYVYTTTIGTDNFIVD